MLSVRWHIIHQYAYVLMVTMETQSCLAILKENVSNFELNNLKYT